MKKVLTLALISATLLLGACNKKNCQTCRLIDVNGVEVQEGDEICEESFFYEGESDCEESENLHNYYAQQNGQDSAFCSCTVEEKR